MSDEIRSFTKEELGTLSSRVMIHGTPDGNKATLAWNDYSCLYATAEEAADLDGFKTHVGTVLSNVLAELRIPRDSSKGSLAEQVAHELRASDSRREP